MTGPHVLLHAEPALPDKAAGSLVAVLVWVYYSAQIFLLGAKLTWVHAHALGSRRSLPPLHGTPRASHSA